MKSSDVRVIETRILPRGFEVDLDEGWRKLTKFQFGGTAGRGFFELNQNSLDSYPANTPINEKKILIDTEKRSISITDYGEGMGLDRIELLLTLGGTDKHDNPTKMGQFGMGFFSMFNPRLGTQEVTVTTRCEGHTVILRLTVHHPEKRPEISYEILDEHFPFSTKIDVRFSNTRAPHECLDHAIQMLKYYPCSCVVNGQRFLTVWEEAKRIQAHFFEEPHIQGFLTHSKSDTVHVLCKFERIIATRTPALCTGGRNMTHDLRDYHVREFACVPGLGATINSNNLSLTISRDSIYTDSAYDNMVRVLGAEELKALYQVLCSKPDKALILANQYILRKGIKKYLEDRTNERLVNEQDQPEAVMRRLAEAKLYRLNGRTGFHSLVDIHDWRSADTPIFFSPRRTNLRWIGGAFKHDFVVLPPDYQGTPDFYDTLFGEVFDDIVNLDNIHQNTEIIGKLVKRGIVDKRALSPDCKIVGARKLSEKERKICHEVDIILDHPSIKQAIAQHLHLSISRIRTVMFEFDIEGQGAIIATGLFDSRGNVLGQGDEFDFECHIDQSTPGIEGDQTILIGLCRDHPLIEGLIESQDPHRAIYALTFCAQELALCQKMLVPYSPFFHIVKERLVADMRRGLVRHLLSDSSPN